MWANNKTLIIGAVVVLIVVMALVGGVPGTDGFGSGGVR